jgi:hypothetical protein
VAEQAPRQIACDESGYEGEKLIGTTTAAFAHASVDLDVAAAAQCIQELRDRIRSPATEYKANHVLREKHGAVLRWILGPASPLRGHAHVYLIDKPFYLLGKVVDLLVGGEQAEDLTEAIYAAGPAALGEQRWAALLGAGNDLLRIKDRQDATTSVETFFGLLADLPELFGPLQAARPKAEEFRLRLLEDSTLDADLDPLIPAIIRALAWWARDERQVLILHDRQNTLTAQRVAQIRRLAGPLGPALAGITLAHSNIEPRVQVADVIAGAIRKIASDELNGHADEQLVELARPFVDPASVWSAKRQWW